MTGFGDWIFCRRMTPFFVPGRGFTHAQDTDMAEF